MVAQILAVTIFVAMFVLMWLSVEDIKNRLKEIDF